MNADLIAAGLSPFAPQTVAIQAGRLMLETIARHVARHNSFAFETTLSGTGYSRQIPRWRAAGFEVDCIFCRYLAPTWRYDVWPSACVMAAMTYLKRSFEGRYDVGLRLMDRMYKHLVDHWILYDNSMSHASGFGLEPEHDERSIKACP